MNSERSCVRYCQAERWLGCGSFIGAFATGSSGSRHSGENIVRPHHLIGLVFEDVAVPKVAAWIALERDHDARDRSRRTLHHVFPAQFMRIRRSSAFGVAQWKRVAGQLVVHGEAAPIEDLKTHEM